MTGSRTKPARRNAKGSAAEPPRQKRTARRQAAVGPATEEAILPKAEADSVATTAASSETTPLASKSPSGKLGIVVTLMRRPEGATVSQMSEATGWQPHSVRGALAGALKRKHKLTIVSEPGEGGRVYRIASEQTA